MSGVPPLADSGLAYPQFIPTDADARVKSAIAAWEAVTGHVLQPAQAERLMVNLVAYENNLLATQVQLALLRQLVDFADYPFIDYLGRFYGVSRLPAAPAQTRLRVSLASARTVPLILAAGTEVLAGALRFALDAEMRLAPGALQAEGTATALVAGTVGNGYAPGQIRAWADGRSDCAVTNVTPTSGGADEESDDALRARVLAAPEMFTVAGSRDAYEGRAREVSAAIIGVSVFSPRPGDIDVTILSAEGMPSAELLAAVQTHLSDRRVRPMGDAVTVRAPRRRPYAIEAALVLTPSADEAATLSAAQTAAAGFVTGRRAALGRDVVPSQIIAALSVGGVHEVRLTAPAAMILASDEWADCTAITVTVIGRADG